MSPVSPIALPVELAAVAEPVPLPVDDPVLDGPVLPVTLELAPLPVAVLPEAVVVAPDVDV